MRRRGTNEHRASDGGGLLYTQDGWGFGLLRRIHGLRPLCYPTIERWARELVDTLYYTSQGTTTCGNEKGKVRKTTAVIQTGRSQIANNVAEDGVSSCERITSVSALYRTAQIRTGRAMLCVESFRQPF